MRKRIQQLANGKFDNNGPKLSLSTEKIELEVLEGKDETGSFVITSTNQVKMRGIIYSSNPRMECLTPQFEGEEVRIRYQFHSEGLIEGDIQKGEFLSYVTRGNITFLLLCPFPGCMRILPLEKSRIWMTFAGLRRKIMMRHTVYFIPAISKT